MSSFSSDLQFHALLGAAEDLRQEIKASDRTESEQKVAEGKCAGRMSQRNRKLKHGKGLCALRVCTGKLVKELVWKATAQLITQSSYPKIFSSSCKSERVYLKVKQCVCVGSY